MCRPFFVVGASLLLSFTLRTLSAGPILYSVDHVSDRLVTIDTSTLVVTPAAQPLGVNIGLCDALVAISETELLAVFHFGDATCSDPSRFYKIDIATGVATYCAEITGDPTEALARNPQSGLVYVGIGVECGPESNELRQVDVVAGCTIGPPCNLAPFDFDSMTFLGNSQLVSVDVTHVAPSYYDFYTVSATGCSHSLPSSPPNPLGLEFIDFAPHCAPQSLWALGTPVGGSTDRYLCRVDGSNGAIVTSEVHLLPGFTGRGLAAPITDCNNNGVPDECDIAVGTIHYSQDFEPGAGPLPEWSSTTVSMTPEGPRHFLGELGNQTVTLTLSDLPPHSFATLSFDIFIIRSWDGNNDPVPSGPDTLEISVGGIGSLLYSSFCGNGLSFLQSYPDQYGQGTHSCSTGGSEFNSLGYLFDSSPMDAVYNIILPIPHTAASISIDFNGTLDTPGVNESWGLDNVRVTLSSQDCNANAVPDECEPDCNMNMIPDECELVDFLQELTAIDGVDETQDYFGSSVAIDSDTIVWGAPGDDTGSATAGAVYVHVRNDGGTPSQPGDDTWMQQAQLLSTDTEMLGDNFGTSVDIDGDFIVVGAPLDDDNGFVAGAAFVYHRDGGGSWSPVYELVAGGATAEYYFGNSVGIETDAIVVGAPFLGGQQSGFAYIFVRDGNGMWVARPRLSPPDGATGDRFGIAVAISGETIIVGATNHDAGNGAIGAIFVFVRDRSGTPGDPTDDIWNWQATLSAADTVFNDRFGQFIAIEANTVVAGAPNHNSALGAVYVFERSNGSWALQAKMIGADTILGDQIGASVAISNGVIVAGANGVDDANSESSGAGYLFRRGPDAQWSDGSADQYAKFHPPDGGNQDSFGSAVALSDDAIAVGVPVHDHAAPDEHVNYPGAGYVFLFGTNDCNNNGVPDECELPPLCPTCVDCNMNMIPDVCEPQQCLADVECNDGQVCTCDRCECGLCVHQPIPFADTNCSCLLPNLDDILKVLDDFSDGPSVTDPNNDICGVVPCMPDGMISIDDILCVLSAFSGTSVCIPLCSDECLQGACCNGLVCTQRSMVNCIQDEHAYQGHGTDCPPAGPACP